MDTRTLARLTLDLPTDVHRRLKVLAARQGVSMKALILGWIERGLTEGERQRPAQ